MAYGSKTSKSSGAKSVVSRVSKTPTKPLSFKEDLESRTGFKPPAQNFRSTQNDEQLILNREVEAATNVSLAIAQADIPLDSEWTEWNATLVPRGVLERTQLILNPGDRIIVRVGTPA